MNEIPYGEVKTYGDIAKKIAGDFKINKCLFEQLVELWAGILFV